MLRRGYVSSLREAFDRYLDTDEYQRIERWKAGAPECIAAIHDAGGKAYDGAADKAKVKCQFEQMLDKIVEEMKQ